jgi:hypothetical protein
MKISDLPLHYAPVGMEPRLQHYVGGFVSVEPDAVIALFEGEVTLRRVRKNLFDGFYVPPNLAERFQIIVGDGYAPNEVFLVRGEA